MRTVTIRLTGDDFSDAIVRIRDWIEKHRCEPKSYRYDQHEDTIAVSVDFAVDAQAKAFAKHFGGQCDDRRLVALQAFDEVGENGIGAV